MYFYMSRGVHVFDLRAGHCQLTASTVGKFAHMTVYLSMCNIVVHITCTAILHVVRVTLVSSGEPIKVRIANH